MFGKVNTFWTYQSDVGTPFGCATTDYPGAEKYKGPLVIMPRKEAPKERLEILGRQAQM